MKQRIGEILEPESKSDFLSRGFNIFIISLIVLNVFAVSIETMQEVSTEYSGSFRAFEWFSMFVFTLEYILRVWTCNLKQEYSSPIMGRIRYMLTPAAIIDLVVVIPFYLPFFFELDLRFLRVLRLFRLFTLFKMARYSKSLHLFKSVLRDTRQELFIVLAVTMGMLVFASGVIYFIENKAQPDAFSSIPAAMWWAVSTMTTVGYGDVYPVTTLGKIFGGFISILGLGTFGLPVGIIAYGFIEELQKPKTRPMNCPHCNKPFDAPIDRRNRPR
ncbi:MAG: ion transporter [Nitrospinae bacterium]|nr:ion transporter [Nitrospinota bacterium]